MENTINPAVSTTEVEIKLDTPTEPIKKKRKWWMILIILVVVIVLITGGYIARKYTQIENLIKENAQETQSINSVVPPSEEDSVANWKSYDSPRIADTNYTFHLKYPPNWTLQEDITLGELRPRFLTVRLTNQGGETLDIMQTHMNGGRCIYYDDEDYGTFKGLGLFYESYTQLIKPTRWRISKHEGISMESHQVCEESLGKYYEVTRIGGIHIDVESENTLREIQSILEQIIIKPWVELGDEWGTYQNSQTGISFMYPSIFSYDESIDPYYMISTDPLIKITIHGANDPMTDECMRRDKTYLIFSDLKVKKYSRITTGETCTRYNPDYREMWVVKEGSDGVGSFVVISYESTDSEEVENIIYQMLSTFKFTK